MQKLTKLLRITSIFSVFIQELIEGIKDTPIFEALHDIHLIMKRQERPGTGEVIIIILLHLRPEGKFYPSHEVQLGYIKTRAYRPISPAQTRR